MSRRQVLPLVLLGATGTALGALGLQQLPALFAVDPAGAGKRGLLMLLVLAFGGLAAAMAWTSPAAVLRALLRPLRRWPRLAASLFGLLLALLLAEGALRLLPARPAVLETRTGEQTTPDPELGYRPRPLGDAHVVLRKPDGALLADVTYHIGSDGFRRTPLPREDGHRRTALLFGCSMSFGFALADDATIASAWAAAAPDEAVHNLAAEGWGPHHAVVLARAQRHRLPGQLAEPGVAVFLWIDHHLDRIAGRLRVVSTFGIDAPCFEVAQDGHLARLGSFHTARPWTTLGFSVLQKSRLLQLAGFDWPAAIGPQHLDLAAALLADLAAALRDHGTPELLVAIYPGEDPQGELRRRLQDRPGIQVAVLDGLFDPLADGVALDPQGHPAPATALLVGRRLASEVVRRWP